MPELFPTEATAVSNQEPSTSTIYYGKSPVFDYEAGEFLTTPTGKIYLADGTQAWVEHCKKALTTERFKYIVYSGNFGHELEDLIAIPLSQAAFESEVKRMVTEALMVDARTAIVADFTFEWGPDALRYSCIVTNTRGETAALSESVVVV